MAEESREERNQRYVSWLVEHRRLVYTLCGVLFAAAVLMVFVLTWSEQDSPIYRVPTYALLGGTVAVVVQTRKAAKDRQSG